MSNRFVGIPELSETAEIPSVAVVIDVMRAFTVAAWILGRGAERIVLAATEEEALAHKAGHPDWLALKDGTPAAGFDAVNSPGLIRSADLAGRTVVQKTTAGTVGALAVENVMARTTDTPLVLCASFVVAGATARFLSNEGAGAGSVTFVITGEDGRADEDRACAEYIAQCLAGDGGEAAAYLQRARASRAAAELANGVRRGYRGIHPDDVELCLELDRFPFAMVARREESMLVLRRFD